MLKRQSVLKHIAIVASLGLLFTAGQVFAKDQPVDFSLKDVKGKTHKLSDYRGKWVVVNFWATWCPPCRYEIPELIEFQKAHHGKDAVVLGLNYEQVDPKYLKEFMDETSINYPVLRVVPGKKLPFGRLRGLPTTVLISPEGIPVEKHTGGVSRAGLEQAIKDFKRESK